VADDGDSDLTLGQASERFAVPRSTLSYAARQGHLRARKLGTLWVTTARAVREWLAHGKHVPGPPAARSVRKD
jgi:excisionase family DNA binding protein